MDWMKNGMISEVFYTDDRRFAFQRVCESWRLYGRNGDFIREFRSFVAMYEYIAEARKRSVK